MMTVEEKLKMYREKKSFVASIAKVFKEHPKGHSISDIRYELWAYSSTGVLYFNEFALVEEVGGHTTAVVINANSNAANFCAIASLVNRGADNTTYYNTQKESGYKKVDLTKLVLTVED